jgi:hypothetical protein
MRTWNSILSATLPKSRQLPRALVFAKLAVYASSMAVHGGANVRASRKTVQAELHWYEATGIGKREMKIKAFI